MAQQSLTSKHRKLRHRKSYQKALKEDKLFPSQKLWMSGGTGKMSKR